MTRKKFIIFIGILTLFLYLVASDVNAQDVERTYWGIIINPAIIHLELDPGEVYNGSLQLKNDFEHGNLVRYYPTSFNFRQRGETGDPEFYYNEDLQIEFNSADWISFSETEYNINFGEGKQSHFEINVPENAEPGGHYVALVYTEEAGDDRDYVEVSKSIASLLFIKVTGDENENGEIVDFKTDKTFYDFTPVNFSIRYKNTGNIHTQVGGNIFIHKGDITKTVDTIKVNEDVNLVLPGSIREYFEEFNNGFITKDGNKFIFNWDQFPKMYFGKYTATLKLRHTVNNERVTTEESIEFWIIPWGLILIVVLILIFIIILYKRRRNRGARKYM